MSFPGFKIFVLRVRWASSEAREAAQSIRGLIFAAVVGPGLSFYASQTKDPSVVLVVGAGLLGLLTPLAVVFVWSFLTIPRRHLEFRADELEEEVQVLRVQMNQFMEEKHGDPLQFLPIYHELRADIREATRIIKRAQETGDLWGRTEAPEYRNWKRRRDEIANNPFARLDNLHGELLEAFDHLERLSRGTSLRFGRRRVKKSDDLGAALEALSIAEDRLNFSITRLESLQSPDELPGLSE